MLGTPEAVVGVVCGGLAPTEGMTVGIFRSCHSTNDRPSSMTCLASGGLLTS